MHLPVPISNEEFEREYAERSGITVAQLNSLGLRPYTCVCDYEECKGFQMLSESTYETLKRLHASAMAGASRSQLHRLLLVEDQETKVESESVLAFLVSYSPARTSRQPVWKLVVDCPHCKKRHLHSTVKDPAQTRDLDTRMPHCGTLPEYRIINPRVAR